MAALLQINDLKKDRRKSRNGGCYLLHGKMAQLREMAV